MESKRRIELTEQQSDFLRTLSEQGMGYQIVDVILKNGKILENKIVFNSMYLQLFEHERIVSEDIKSIQLHKDNGT
jgi:hypothetical protein